MTVPYIQSVELCLSERIAGMGVARADLVAAAHRLQDAVSLLDYPNVELEAVMDSARVDDDLPRLQEIARDWRQRFSKIYVIGMGGASLGARALLALADRGAPLIEVIDNLDVLRTDRLVADLDDHTGVLLISKSGETLETMSLGLSLAATFVEKFGVASPGRQMLAITQQGDSPLRRFASAHDIVTLDHDSQLGGRFSVLSLVGMLPALLAGLDATAFRQGALTVLDRTMSDGVRAAPAVGAALQFVALQKRKLSQHVLLGYAAGLADFGLWHRQLWAESLGKYGQGSTPLTATGPMDQHSQMQLYLDGPVDKLFTVLALDHSGKGPDIPLGMALGAGLTQLSGRTVGDVVAAMQRATVETLARRGRPVRTLTLAILDEQTMGALFMHFMLETVFAAALFGVPAFNQPSVEECKNLASVYLTEQSQ